MDDTRLTGLDLVRATACLLVLFHHLFQRLSFASVSGSAWADAQVFFTGTGAFGVGIFFMLSGFLLARPYWRSYDAAAPMPRLSDYAMRRAARIMPGFYVALTVSLALAVTVFAAPFDLGLVARYLAGLAFIGEFHWFTLYPTELNGPLWSIGMEVASYALLPAGFWVVFAMRDRLPGWRGRFAWAGVVAAAIVVHVVIISVVPVADGGRGWEFGLVGGAKYLMPFFNPAGFFVFFALGSLAAGVSMLWQGRSALADLLAVCGLAYAALVMTRYAPAGIPEAPGLFELPYAFPLFHFGIAMALISLPHARLLGPIVDAAPVAFIAKVSFGIYIWHYVVLELVRSWVAADFGHAGISDLGRWFVISALVCALTLLAATSSWYVVEKPVLDLVRRRQKRRAAPLAEGPDASLAGLRKPAE